VDVQPLTATEYEQDRINLVPPFEASSVFTRWVTSSLVLIRFNRFLLLVISHIARGCLMFQCVAPDSFHTVTAVSFRAGGASHQSLPVPPRLLQCRLCGIACRMIPSVPLAVKFVNCLLWQTVLIAFDNQNIP
jgi:hypothetical protein